MDITIAKFILFFEYLGHILGNPSIVEASLKQSNSEIDFFEKLIKNLVDKPQGMSNPAVLKTFNSVKEVGDWFGNWDDFKKSITRYMVPMEVSGKIYPTLKCIQKNI